MLIVRTVRTHATSPQGGQPSLKHPSSKMLYRAMGKIVIISPYAFYNPTASSGESHWPKANSRSGDETDQSSSS